LYSYAVAVVWNMFLGINIDFVRDLKDETTGICFPYGMVNFEWKNTMVFAQFSLGGKKECMLE
jgi:hypothetical protein